MDTDDNGGWHLNNEMLRQYDKSGAADQLQWGFNGKIRLILQAAKLEHMMIDYYADNKHRHWTEPDNPKWAKFSKKYYGLPQYDEDYTGHPDNIHLHDYYNGEGGEMTKDFFDLKYRNKLRKGLVLRPDDEAGKARYLATLKDMRDHPEAYEWGDLSAYPEDSSIYLDTEHGKDGEDRTAPDGYKSHKMGDFDDVEKKQAKPTEEDYPIPGKEDGPKLTIMGTQSSV